MKKRVFWLTIVFTLILTVFPAAKLLNTFAASNAEVLTPLTYNKGSYYILAETLTVRSQPNVSSSKLTTITKGQIVNVTDVSGKWGKVTANGKTGWIDLSYAFSSSNKINVEERLSMLRQKFPHGMYWNREDPNVDNSDGYTDIPCEDKHTDKRENYFDGTCQCHGFALKLGYDIFGIHAARWERHYDLSKVKVGDLIRYKAHHTVTVTGVYNDYFTVADCNWDYHCGIQWDRKMMKSYITFTSDSYDGVYHCPANGGFVNGSGGNGTTTSTTKATTTTTSTIKASVTTTTASTTASATTTTLPSVYTTGKLQMTGDNVNVRKGAGTDYAVIATVKKGESFTYTSEKTVNGDIWYYITVNSSTKGWVIGKYCKVTQKLGGVVTTAKATTTTTTSTTTTTTKSAVYTTGKLQMTGDNVNVRKGPGTNYAVVAKVKKGSTYTYTAEKTVNGSVWYYITVNSSTKGWVIGKYCKVTQKLGAPIPVQYKVQVTGDTVNVRSGAGTNYSVVTTVKKGSKYDYVESKTVDGVVWYKINLSSSKSGWISSKYSKKISV